MLKKGSKRGSSSTGRRTFYEENSLHKFNRIKKTNLPADNDGDFFNTRNSQDQVVTPSNSSSPYNIVSPVEKSPWSSQRITDIPSEDNDDNFSPNVLMGSLVREEGHIYSLAASGHQDGKIRVWKVSSKDPSIHKRVGTLPTMRDCFNNSMKTSNYFEVKRHKNAVWYKHGDAISCLSLSEDKTFLYSSSWDKTFKVWRISNSRCLESVISHDDAVNSIVAGSDGLVFTGSADGTVKVWRRELQGTGTKHFFSQTLLKQECAVTAVAVNPNATVVYCGSSDGLVNFWEREKHMSHGGVLRGHKLAILCLVTAGSLLFSGSADMGICVWRRMGNDHVCLSLLAGHNGPVKCLAAEKDHESSPNERRWILYSGSLDKSVKMWRVSENAPPLAWRGCAS
ncbi:hypothetical protein D5086_014716 [Populus alba]|uniref:Uncharacterized protein n=1 Tax=Populus alba TaxID=43335 RepID=A0ACC4BYH0_POPAL